MNWANSFFFFKKLRKPCLQTDGQTDWQTDGQTSGWIQYTPIPPSVEWGYNKLWHSYFGLDDQLYKSTVGKAIRNIYPSISKTKYFFPLTQAKACLVWINCIPLGYTIPGWYRRMCARLRNGYEISTHFDASGCAASWWYSSLWTRCAASLR